VLFDDFKALQSALIKADPRKVQGVSGVQAWQPAVRGREVAQ
jgi:hypothetical protein